MFFVTGSISYLLLSLFVVCSSCGPAGCSFVAVRFVHVMALMVGWMLELKLVVLEVVLDVAGWYWKALGGRTGGRNDGCADWRGGRADARTPVRTLRVFVWGAYYIGVLQMCIVYLLILLQFVVLYIKQCYAICRFFCSSLRETSSESSCVGQFSLSFPARASGVLLLILCHEARWAEIIPASSEWGRI